MFKNNYYLLVRLHERMNKPVLFGIGIGGRNFLSHTIERTTHPEPKTPSRSAILAMSQVPKTLKFALRRISFRECERTSTHVDL